MEEQEPTAIAVPAPFVQQPYLTPEELREIVAVILVIAGVLTLAGGVWAVFGAGWGCMTGGFASAIAGLALLNEKKEEA